MENDDEILDLILAQGKAIEAMAVRLEKIENTNAATRGLKLRNRAWLYAKDAALIQWATEISGRLGVTSPVASQRFRESVKWHYDAYMQKMGDAIPGLVSQADDRGLEDIPLEENPPPILPPETLP